MLLTEKYRPKSLKEVIGHEKEIDEIKKWLENWKDNKKPLLLVGGPGTGKTSIAYALSNDYNLELHEINASDERNKDLINNVIRGFSEQKSFFKKGKILLIDEIDGSSSGMSEIAKFLDNAKIPVILTANDLYASGMDKIRDKCSIIKLNKINARKIYGFLKEICNKDGIRYEESALKSLASRSNGDLRVALNDLQSLPEITQETLKYLGYRDIEKNIFDSLLIIFKTEKIENAILSVENLDVDDSMLLEWIRENIVKEYEKKSEIAKAFAFISLADLYKGRIIKRQSWSLRKYIYDFLTGGISISKDRKYRKFTRYSFPSTIKRRAKMKINKEIRKSLENKFMEKLHVPSKDFYEFVKLMGFLMKDGRIRENLISELNISEGEIEYLKNLVRN